MIFLKKKLIKTTEKARGLYAAHLNKLYSHSEGDFHNEHYCYLCDAAADIARSRERSKMCDVCPLPTDVKYCDNAARKINLRNKYKGGKTRFYHLSTPASIRKHARWIEKWIKKNTDCDFDWVEK